MIWGFITFFGVGAVAFTWMVATHRAVGGEIGIRVAAVVCWLGLFISVSVAVANASAHSHLTPHSEAWSIV